MTVTTSIALDPDKEYEIVDGQPEEKPMGGARHSRVGVRLISRLDTYVDGQGLGAVYGPDATFKIGSNDRLPDVSFVAVGRIPPEGDPEGPWLIAPDLAVEIVSPNDLHEKVHGKIREYFAAGVRQVWLVSPEYRTISVYHSPMRVTIYSEEDELLCEDVVPGFRMRDAELFTLPARSEA